MRKYIVAIACICVCLVGVGLVAWVQSNRTVVPSIQPMHGEAQEQIIRDEGLTTTATGEMPTGPDAAEAREQNMVIFRIMLFVFAYIALVMVACAFVGLLTLLSLI